MVSQEQRKTAPQILLLTPELLSIGGIQRQNRLLIVALDALLAGAGGRVRVLALNDPTLASLGTELESLQVTLITCFGGRRLEYVRRALVESRDADLVIYGLLGFAPVTFAQALLRHANFKLLMLHGIEAWTYRSFWHGLAVNQMQGYVAVSQYTLNRFRSAYRIDGAKPGFVLPNVVSPRLCGDNLIYPSGNDRELRLLTVCRLDASERYKGVETVVRSLPMLVKRFPNLRYSVIGEGPDRLRLAGIARSLQVEQYVDFLGHVSDEALKHAYASCTVFVLPSSKEGFGFVFIEAMAFGKPVVAARAGATAEVVCDGRTGLLVEYDNVPQLTEALASLLGDPQLCQRMGQAGLEAVRTSFSLGALKANLSKILTACGLALLPGRD